MSDWWLGFWVFVIVAVVFSTVAGGCDYYYAQRNDSLTQQEKACVSSGQQWVHTDNNFQCVRSPIAQ